MAILQSLRSWWIPTDTRPTSLFGGIPVTFDGFDAHSPVEDILALPPVESCIGIIARSLSQVKLGIKVQSDKAWVEPTSGALADLHEILSSLPNTDETASHFFDTLTRDVLSTQTAYALVLRDGRGDVRSMRRLDPAWVVTSRDAQGRKVWTVSVPGRDPKVHTLDDPSRPPLLDIAYHSPVFACPAFWAFAIAVYRVGSRYYTQGARSQGVLSADAVLTTEEANALRQSWRALTEGSGPVVLGSGMKWMPLGANIEEAQLPTLLSWVTETVASLFGVPPSRLGLPQRTSYASAEADSRALVSQAVSPLLTCVTQSLRRDLLSNAQFRSVKIHADTSSLIQIDTDVQARTLSSLHLAGVLSRDEVRASLGRDPGEGPDVWVTPLNVGTSVPLDGSDSKPTT